MAGSNCQFECRSAICSVVHPWLLTSPQRLRRQASSLVTIVVSSGSVVMLFAAAGWWAYRIAGRFSLLHQSVLARVHPCASCSNKAVKILTIPSFAQFKPSSHDCAESLPPSSGVPPLSSAYAITERGTRLFYRVKNVGFNARAQGECDVHDLLPLYQM